MKYLASNEEIGIYLKDNVNTKFKSHRKFCKEYLRECGDNPNNEDEIRKLANRFSQIFKGTKGLQLSDLPPVSLLLDMSYEEILSAGKNFAESSSHMSNYSVALSTDEKQWERYLNHPTKPLVNADEFGKTIIDYALKFKNYGLLKYLCDKKYIYFTDTGNEALFSLNFGAGTKVKSNPLEFRNLDVLNHNLASKHELRAKMITLAIENKDIDMLKDMKAREIPYLYMLHYTHIPVEFNSFLSKELISSLTTASDEVLEYFSESFEIIDQYKKNRRFIFPFMPQFIEALTESNSTYTEYVLKNAINHNEYIFNELRHLIKKTFGYLKKDRTFISHLASSGSFKKAAVSIFKNDFITYIDDSNCIKYSAPAKIDFLSNCVSCDILPNAPRLKHLLFELNSLNNSIHDLTQIIERAFEEMNFLITDINTGASILPTSDTTGISENGDIYNRISDSTAINTTTGEIHSVSLWENTSGD